MTDTVTTLGTQPTVINVVVSDSLQISKHKLFGTLQGTNVRTKTSHKVTGITSKQGQDLDNKQLLARKEPLS